jgi:hypothetical protein
VIFSIDPRRATQCRHVTKIPSPQLLLFPALTNCDARNSFRTLRLRAVSARRIRSYAKCRVTSFKLDIFLFSPCRLYPYLPHLSPLNATLMHRLVSSANKRLISLINPLDATLTKNRGWGQSGAIVHLTVHSTLPPIFRTFFQVPYPLSPLLATLTKTPGVWGYSSRFGTLLSPLATHPSPLSVIGFPPPHPLKSPHCPHLAGKWPGQMRNHHE